MTGDQSLVPAIVARLDRLDVYAAEVEERLATTELGGDELEHASAQSIRLRDALWAIRNDRLRTAAAVAELAGRQAGVATLAGYLSVHQAFAAIDYMEVRGRDSAGINVFVWNHGLGADDSLVVAALDPARPGPAVSERLRALHARLSVVRLQGGGRDRRTR